MTPLNCRLPVRWSGLHRPARKTARRKASACISRATKVASKRVARSKGCLVASCNRLARPIPCDRFQMLVDSHCHLDFPELTENLPKVLQLMQSNNIGCAACIGVNLEDFPRILSLAEAHPHLWATVGVHPEVTEVREPTLAELVQLAQHPKIDRKSV